ncbi:hypothetical protein [Winogradskyella schleiferi]|uniref:hypothetical protein n=1 Tax=Winogradskyella schleiferi TaxID=2686078 RepID=UPI0015BEAF9D|nr:hypothetical protein [Winogradskyella schleiferi]
MKPKSHYVFTLLLVLIFTACSPEDNTTIPEDTNEFIFDGVTYPLTTAIIIDENTSATNPSPIKISLWNKTSSEATGNGDLEDIALVNFEIEDTNLHVTNYTDIEVYDISINGFIVNSEFSPGTILLSNDDSEADTFAQSSSVNITNFTAYNIVFTFTFMRNDGQVISGSYDGNYLLPSN